MHDGGIATLHEAVELELNYRSLASPPIPLTAAEKVDLVEFLKALTSPDAVRPQTARPH